MTPNLVGFAKWIEAEKGFAGQKHFGPRLTVVYNLKFVQLQNSIEEGEARNGGSI